MKTKEPTFTELVDGALSDSGAFDRNDIDKVIGAVNCHDELVEACKQAMKALQHWGNKAESYEKANDPIRMEAHAKLWEAIAKAEGK